MGFNSGFKGLIVSVE